MLLLIFIMGDHCQHIGCPIAPKMEQWGYAPTAIWYFTGKKKNEKNSDPSLPVAICSWQIAICAFRSRSVLDRSRSIHPGSRSRPTLKTYVFWSEITDRDLLMSRSRPVHGLGDHFNQTMNWSRSVLIGHDLNVTGRDLLMSRSRPVRD